MGESTIMVAFDQHAKSVVAAVLAARDTTPALHSLNADLPTIGRFVAQLHERGELRCCYEAGPCGFALQRFLTERGIPCDVIAPGLIPRRGTIAITRTSAGRCGLASVGRPPISLNARGRPSTASRGAIADSSPADGLTKSR